MLTTYFGSLDMIRIGDELSVLPVPVPHSGSDNVAFIASYRGERAAVITDLGSWTDELVKHVYGCEHISIEANYDENRLNSGPYPFSLKERIRGRGGHLSNNQTGQFLAEVCTEATRSIVLTHLSEKNNSPHLAESTVLYYISDVFDGDIHISLQDGPEKIPRYPRTSQDAPRTPPRRPKDTSKTLPRQPKMPPRCPKMPQDGSKSPKPQDAQKRSKTAQVAFKTAQDASRSRFCFLWA